jgi:proline iminopeptidase
MQRVRTFVFSREAAGVVALAILAVAYIADTRATPAAEARPAPKAPAAQAPSAAKPGPPPAKPLPPEPGSQTFEPAPGVTIYYEVRGQGTGTPLIIANGGPGFDHAYLHCSDAWDRLAANRRVVFYDQRGDGRSGDLKEGESLTLLDEIADLDALRQKIGAEKFDLLGHSWGGYLAMSYAARHPERIERLIINDSAAPKIQDTAFLFNKIFPETTSRQDAMAFAEALGDPEAVAASLREYMTMIYFQPEVRDREVARSAAFVYKQKVNRMLWTEAQNYDLNPELAKYRFPTLVITGRYDFNVAPSVAYGIHRAVPNSEFAVFEKSGHLPFCEEPDAFVTRVDAFLRGR